MKLQALKTMKSLDPEPVLWLSSKLKLTDGIPLQGKAACMGHLSQTILAFGVTTNVSAGDQAWPRNLHDAGLRTRVLQRACGSHFMTPLCFYIWKIPVPEVDCQGCCERRLACPTAPSSPWGLWGGGFYAPEVPPNWNLGASRLGGRRKAWCPGPALRNFPNPSHVVHERTQLQLGVHHWLHSICPVAPDR